MAALILESTATACLPGPVRGCFVSSDMRSIYPLGGIDANCRGIDSSLRVGASKHNSVDVYTGISLVEDETAMTSVEVVFSYGAVPDEAVLRGIDDLREVYGIRRVRFQEAERTVRVEYDATRLNEDAVASLLRRAGIEVTSKVALV